MTAAGAQRRNGIPAQRAERISFLNVDLALRALNFHGVLGPQNPYYFFAGGAPSFDLFLRIFQKGRHAHALGGSDKFRLGGIPVDHAFAFAVNLKDLVDADSTFIAGPCTVIAAGTLFLKKLPVKKFHGVQCIFPRGVIRFAP